ncbi:MAG: DUF1192 family protein [Pseudomonadota bacterium]
MDEETPIPAHPPLDLERLSEEELEARILNLREEIQACQTELDRKRAHRSAADALFGGR